LDIGTAIAIGVPSGMLFVSAAAVIITAIKTKGITTDVHTRENSHIEQQSAGVHNAPNPHNVGDFCFDHRMVLKTQEDVAAAMKKFDERQDKFEERQEERFKELSCKIDELRKGQNRVI
jgi:peptidoglycan hydrolase CwlO-like protein